MITFDVTDKPDGRRTILTVSDGVLKGRDVRRMAADCRAQQAIPTMTARILAENKIAAGQGDYQSKHYGNVLSNSITTFDL
jgi:hypothetical protein